VGSLLPCFLWWTSLSSCNACRTCASRHHRSLCLPWIVGRSYRRRRTPPGSSTTRPSLFRWRLADFNIVRTALSLRSSSGANTESWINLINDSAKIQDYLATKSAATPYRNRKCSAIDGRGCLGNSRDAILGVRRPPVLLFWRPSFFLAAVSCARLKTAVCSDMYFRTA
jgi:hypothetical protein